MSDLLTVREVGAILKVGTNKAYEIVARPDFKKIKLGRQIRVHRAWLESWIEKNSDNVSVE